MADAFGDPSGWQDPVWGAFDAPKTRSTSPDGPLAYKRAARGTSSELDSTIRRDVETSTGVSLAGVSVREDDSAHRESSRRRAHALAKKDEILLGGTVDTQLGPTRREALAHEAIHIAQIRIGEVSNSFESYERIEEQASALARSGTELADPRLLRPASDREVYRLAWIPALAAGAAFGYAMLRPNIANAPDKGDRTYDSVSLLQVGAESLVVGVLSAAALEGAAAVGLGSISFNAVRTYVSKHAKAMGVSGVANALANVGVQLYSHGTDFGRWNIPSVLVDLIFGAISYGLISKIVTAIPITLSAPNAAWYQVHKHIAAILKDTPSILRQQTLVWLYAILSGSFRGDISNVETKRAAGAQYAAGTTQFWFKNALRNFLTRAPDASSTPFADWRVAVLSGAFKVVNKAVIRALFGDVPSSTAESERRPELNQSPQSNG